MDALKKRFQKSQDFKPYISSIVFPAYKNIFPLSELTLDFPLTLLIGENGTNKSSILHALYGCPVGKSTGEYWFATHIDPISRAAYFYRYEIPKTGDIAEVVKTIIKKRTLSKTEVVKKIIEKQKVSIKDYDPDYWEPSRPIMEFGMAPLPDIKNNQKLPEGRSKTRWNAIKKEVLYLDFRSEISAFDKAFYKDSKTISRPEHRTNLRKSSKRLKRAIDDDLAEYTYYKKEKITKNHTFSSDKIKLVNRILGSEYSRITYIEHDFYSSDSFSVYLQKKDGNQSYSEAFAGSGETSVVRLVYALEDANPKSLVLLDEPETSLHIKAQYELQKYIIEKIKEKHLQVVISTHSPFFTTDLPNCAIKILSVDPASKGKVRILNSAPAHESSFHLGYRSHDANKINIYVEDMLAKAVVDHVCNKHLKESQRDLLTVQCYPGGTSALINMAGAEINKRQSNVAFLFDGDFKPSAPIQGSEDIPQSKNNELKTIIIGYWKDCPKIPCDSNNNEQKISNYRDFIDYAKKRFRYLPFDFPEKFLVENHEALKLRADKNSPKLCLRKYTEELLGSSGKIHANDILAIQRKVLSEIPNDHQDFKIIADYLKYFINLAPSSF